jgi:hypothetical protein
LATSIVSAGFGGIGVKYFQNPEINGYQWLLDEVHQKSGLFSKVFLNFPQCFQNILNILQFTGKFCKSSVQTVGVG